MRTTIKCTLVVLQLLFWGTVYSQNYFWQDVTESTLRSANKKQLIVPEKGRTLLLNEGRLRNFFNSVPKENPALTAASPAIITIPMPDGGLQNFTIVETTTMEPALAAAVPEIKTFGGQAVDDANITIKIDMTPFGFHAMVLGHENGAYYIDPFFRENEGGYISYYRKDLRNTTTFIENDVFLQQQQKKIANQKREQAGPCIGTVLRTYQLAIACTGEYAQAVGATTKEQALAAIVTTVNRVNGIYEKDLAVRLVLVANNLKIVFINPATDKFDGNNDALVLIDESQKVITDSIGSANFDVGHTFSTGGGGLASQGVVCRNSEKASGVTGNSSPKGDAYDIDYVAHELGHQFGASHTFNANTGNCSGNGVSTANVEPGSGSTIMAYAGICGSNNLQVNSDAYFHAISLAEINSYLNTISGFPSCADVSNTGNAPPSVNAGADYVIPRSTPFTLTGSATDPNNDVLTFCWEQIDFGGSFGNASAPVGNAPLFRSFPPTASPSRTFPRLTNIINNSTTIGELLPTYARDINLRLTARDNRSGGGGVCSDDMKIAVDGNSGPFVVTNPNTATNWEVGTFKTITWNVANTTSAPVNCANVSIALSTDGGLTYPVTLLASTPNDGSEEIRVPANLTTQARIRVMAVGNVFFDISNANFTIQNATTSTFVLNTPAVTTSCNGVNLSTEIKTGSLNGYTTPITFSANGVPAGVTLNFSANPVTPNNNTTATLQGTLAPGRYIITVNAQSGSDLKSQNLEFNVGPLTTAPTLNQPASNTTGVATTPSFSWSAVSGATSYNLEIASNSSFSNIVFTASNITSTTYALASPLAENTEYYWRVKANNACGAGTPSAGGLFRTVAVVCNSPVVSTDLPKIISATGTPSVTSDLIINNGVVISDINVVGLKGTHDYISDIGIKLTSPNNTTVILFDQVCDNEKNFDLNLDDQASTATFPCPPIGGVTIRPTEPLSNFNGQSSTGTWVLTVKDYYDTDGGSLTGWGLRICSNAATPLPVNWLTFTAAKNNNNSVALQWSTANELKNNRYEIERSSDGINFSSIGSIKGGNNPAMLQQYYFNDLKPFAGVNYYRLKQIDADGLFTYSPVATVVFDAVKQTWTIFPNPSKGITSIRMLTNANKVNVLVSDASGKVVYSKYHGSARAGEQIQLPLNGVAKGMYMVQVATDTELRTQKIVIN